jgi:hypothetical protein
MRPEFDDKDQAILDMNMAEMNKRKGPRVGDWIRFADGVERRISYIWDFGDENRIQTAMGDGSFYLAFGYCSMSGGMYRGIDAATLTETSETKDGMIWFFHHDFAMAHNGVYKAVPFRVFTSTLNGKDV